EIKLTLTTMGCPFADQIKENIKKSLEEIDRINKVEVKLVWYPAWTPDKMSRYARIALGVH
ncbi:MAG: metal-sulfur cluster assembly factor, partial [Atopostipes suicloacalis]|nr:metal-sulfur cluster assembly factor [Atopostipes suicloacalis]